MHLRELIAWRRLNEKSAPPVITTIWMTKPAVLVNSSAAYYQPAGVIGIVVPLQDALTDWPHFIFSMVCFVLSN